jgi:hypothetical protein
MGADRRLVGGGESSEAAGWVNGNYLTRCRSMSLGYGKKQMAKICIYYHFAKYVRLVTFDRYYAHSLT